MTLKGVLLDADSMGADIDTATLHQVLTSFEQHGRTRPEQVAERIADADVVLTNKVVLDAGLIRKAPKLKLICVLATGMNNVDLEAAAEAGIPVRNAVAYGTNSVAQHTLMLMLMLATRQPLYRKSVERAEWQQSPFFCMLQHPVTELAGRHLVIVGAGELGHKVAQLAQAFDLRVSFAARPGSEMQDRRPTLDQLLPEADILSLHCPLTDNTRNLINAQRLSQAKPELLLINCARGGIVNEKDALDALRRGTISGLATDVLSEEPPVNGNPLLDALQEELNLIVTPHNAWISQNARQNIIQQATEAIRAFQTSPQHNT